MESTVTKSLQENFQNTIYPIILENISISEDGEFRNTKSTGSTTDIQDNSMSSENYYRECREEHAFKLKNYRKDKSVSVKVINKALIDLHFWIENSGMAYSTLAEKVIFLENLLKSFRENLDGTFFTNILPQLISLKASSFKNDYIDQSVEDQAKFRDFLLTRFYKNNPDILDSFSSQKLKKEFAERIKILVKMKETANYTANYEGITKLFLKDPANESAQTEWKWGDNISDYTATDFTNALQQLAEYAQGENKNSFKIFDFGSLDIEMVENELKSRQTLGMLHPIILINYMQSLEKYKRLFYEIKMLSYGVTEMLDGALLKIATSLVIQDVRIFNPEEFSSFFIRTKLLYYNIESSFGKCCLARAGHIGPLLCGKAWRLIRNKSVVLLAALSESNDEAEKPVEKEEEEGGQAILAVAR